MKSEHFKNSFYWQAGYAVYFISNDHLESVVNYIDQQHVHHKKCTFQEDFIKLLASNAVAFDERYVWD
jgi:putative transposase